MCQYSSIDGFADEWHLVHLGSRAVGGAGLVMTEATAVSPEGRITPKDLGLWKDEHMGFLKKITDFIRRQNSVPGIQLAHAGRKASHHRPWEGGAFLQQEEGRWPTLAPSPLPFKNSEPAPISLDESGINKVIEDFRDAAARAVLAGFEIVEIHAAHGYLLHEFLSPLSNKRDDSYGGSFENRTRILIEIIHAIRKVWNDERPLFVRISATDWTEAGWTIEDSVALAKLLKKNSVDLIDCSSGGNTTGVHIPLAPLYQTPFAERIKKETGIMTGAVGLITSASEAESIVAGGKADLVLMAREVLRDPYFPLHAASELGTAVPWPLQYERAEK
jgi:2,4-dienoyl-CoA reductase-like NADH-dependent reductase (Old Yellow Enzyme family)